MFLILFQWEHNGVLFSFSQGGAMEAGLSLTGYDFVVVGLTFLLIARGVWLGFLRQVTGLLSLFLGYYVASQYHDRLFPFLKDISENPKVVFVVSVVLLFAATYIAAMLLGKGLSRVIEIVISKWFDKVLGAILGAAMAVCIVVLLHMILGSVLAPEDKMLRDCRTCDVLNMMTDYTRAFIQDEEVRKSFMQQTPAISSEEVIDFLQGRQGPVEAVE
ncbi:MAG: CvpA family protein [Desulfopila sp.]|nr:CvpA family protein [Desulfopila sp.]